MQKKDAKQDVKKNSNLPIEKQLEEIFKTERGKYLAFIDQRIQGQVDAEDILQDVFTNILFSACRNEKKQPIENIYSWIFTALRNKIIDSYRKKRAANFSNIKTSNESVDYENFIEDASQGPEISLVRKTIWEAIQEGLKTLPDEQRIVFERNEFEGISFKEMSIETGVNINTLLARKRYAVLHLRKYLKDIYENVK